MIRKLPIDTQTFEIIRKENYVYVDKTSYIQKLLDKGRIFFLSRPRRFGKSLFVSTLESYFLGRKELFNGLDIESYENTKGKDAWQEYPVIPFYLSGGNFNIEGGLSSTLASIMDQCISNYGLRENPGLQSDDLSVRFRTLIQSLSDKTSKPVVVLVDEYDNPLLKAENKSQEDANRDFYKNFFGVLKDQDQYLKFVFFTGVTKFSKVSIFSDLNQLKDISMLDQFSGICGFTEREIEQNFMPEIQAMSDNQGISETECLGKLREMYDGYHFSRRSEGVYNPYSLLNALSDQIFDNYWFESATPSFLMTRLNNKKFAVQDFENGIEADESELKDYRTDNTNPVPLFYQSGYLTIKNYDPEFGTFELGFPNREVKYSFLRSLIPYVYGEQDSDKSFSAKNMVTSLRKGDTDALYDQLYSLFASSPYMTTDATKYEEVWRNQIYLVFEILGEYVICEQHTARGRSDCVVETQDYIYLFEFKVDKSADAALKQIDDKDYAGRYKASGKHIIKIGVDFSSSQRNIDEWKVSR